jgi:hypothetical protein
MIGQRSTVNDYELAKLGPYRSCRFATELYVGSTVTIAMTVATASLGGIEEAGRNQFD